MSNEPHSASHHIIKEGIIKGASTIDRPSSGEGRGGEGDGGALEERVRNNDGGGMDGCVDRRKGSRTD